jgi:hypothetical protein
MAVRDHKLLLNAALASILVSASTPAFGQWIHYEKRNVPRLANGKVNMTAPAPKQADDKPDLAFGWATTGGPWEQDPILLRAP